MHPSYPKALEQPGSTVVHVMNATSVFDMGVRSLHSLVLHFLTQGESAESCKVARNDPPGCGNILSDLPILEGLCPILATLHPRQTDICSSTTPSWSGQLMLLSGSSYDMWLCYYPKRKSPQSLEVHKNSDHVRQRSEIVDWVHITMCQTKHMSKSQTKVLSSEPLSSCPHPAPAMISSKSQKSVFQLWHIQIRTLWHPQCTDQ